VQTKVKAVAAAKRAPAAIVKKPASKSPKAENKKSPKAGSKNHDKLKYSTNAEIFAAHAAKLEKTKDRNRETTRLWKLKNRMLKQGKSEKFVNATRAKLEASGLFGGESGAYEFAKYMGFPIEHQQTHKPKDSDSATEDDYDEGDVGSRQDDHIALKAPAATSAATTNHGSMATLLAAAAAVTPRTAAAATESGRSLAAAAATGLASFKGEASVPAATFLESASQAAAVAATAPTTSTSATGALPTSTTAQDGRSGSASGSASAVVGTNTNEQDGRSDPRQNIKRGDSFGATVSASLSFAVTAVTQRIAGASGAAPSPAPYPAPAPSAPAHGASEVSLRQSTPALPDETTAANDMPKTTTEHAGAAPAAAITPKLQPIVTTVGNAPSLTPTAAPTSHSQSVAVTTAPSVKPVESILGVGKGEEGTSEKSGAPLPSSTLPSQADAVLPRPDQQLRLDASGTNPSPTPESKSLPPPTVSLAPSPLPAETITATSTQLMPPSEATATPQEEGGDFGWRRFLLNR
jgi:hypothetical protein